MRTKNAMAVALGKLARGVPKRYSQAELERRRRRMVALNKARSRKQPVQMSD